MSMDPRASLNYGFVIDTDEQEDLPDEVREDAWEWVEKRAKALGLTQLRVELCGSDGYLGYVICAGRGFSVEWSETVLIEDLPDRREHLSALEQLRDELGLSRKRIGWHLSSLYF